MIRGAASAQKRSEAPMMLDEVVREKEMKELAAPSEAAL